MSGALSPPRGDHVGARRPSKDVRHAGPSASIFTRISLRAAARWFLSCSPCLSFTQLITSHPIATVKMRTTALLTLLPLIAASWVPRQAASSVSSAAVSGASSAVASSAVASGASSAAPAASSAASTAGNSTSTGPKVTIYPYNAPAAGVTITGVRTSSLVTDAYLGIPFAAARETRLFPTARMHTLLTGQLSDLSDSCLPSSRPGTPPPFRRPANRLRACSATRPHTAAMATLRTASSSMSSLPRVRMRPMPTFRSLSGCMAVDLPAARRASTMQA